MIKSILYFGFIWLALPADNKKMADIQFLLIFILFFLLFLLSFAVVMSPGFNVDGIKNFPWKKFWLLLSLFISLFFLKKMK